MKKLMIILVFCLTLVGTAIAGCWMHPYGEYVRWQRPTTITINGLGYFNPNHTDEDLYAAGYRYVENTPECPIWEMFYDYDGLAVYQIFMEETNQIVEVDASTYRCGLQFAGILERYFPNVGAVTNRIITETYISDFFAAKLIAGTMTAEDLGYVTMLDRLFEILNNSPYNPSKGTTWDFPFGQQFVPQPLNRKYYVKNGERIYLN